MKRILESARVRRAAVALMVAMVCCASALAADGDGGTTGTIDSSAIVTAFTNGFNSMVVNSINMITAMVPIALTLAGTIFLVRKAMTWFKATAK